MDAQESILSEDESWQDAQRKPLRSEQADNVPDRPSAPSQFVVIGGRAGWWGGGRRGGRRGGREVESGEEERIV